VIKAGSMLPHFTTHTSQFAYLCLKNVCNFVKKKNRCLVTFVGEAISGTGDILEGKVSVKLYLNSFIDRFYIFNAVIWQ
jgi:hypothetical protein